MKWVSVLKMYVAKRIAFSDSIVNTRISSGMKDAAGLVEGGEGKRYTDSIRTVLGKMEDIEQGLLVMRKKKNETSISRLNTILYVVLSGFFLLGLLIIRRIKTDITRHRESEQRALQAISERKKADEQISHMAKLMEATSEPVFSTDLDFRIRSWNKAAEELYGFKAAEVEGQPVAEMLRPQITETFRQQIRREMKEIGFWKGEVTHLKKDGTPIALLVSNTATKNQHGEIEGFVNVCRDISERKKNEDAIREMNASLEKRVEEKTKAIIASEKQLRHTLDNMLEGAQIIGFDWKYLYVNDSMARHGKYPKEELIGFTVMEKYPGIEHTEIYKVYEKCFNERVSIHLENEFVFPDQSKGWFELSFQPVPEGIFILSMDITERKKAQLDIEQLNAELEQKVTDRTALLQLANKELESFTYSVSHDLRSPLRIIDGYADILITDYKEKLDAEGNRVLSIIKSNARRMGQLIDDLLNLSQIGRKEPLMHLTDMDKLVKDVTEEQLQFLTTTIKIDIGELEPAVCDSSLVRQVWINLVSNAIKYSSKVTTPVIAIRSERKDGSVIYSVRDNGVGFDMKYEGKLFGVFQRLHKVSEFEGTGIGLALSKRIVLMHKGNIWAEAAPGKGACFFFSLPDPIDQPLN
jgi:PAS domain S-box-containing protein